MTLCQQGLLYLIREGYLSIFLNGETKSYSRSPRYVMEIWSLTQTKLINQTNPNDPSTGLLSVQSVVVDPADRLWILDTGGPLFQQTKYGGPKLVGVRSENGSGL